MSDLLRYRVTSQDGAPARFDESETGYWTPWHIAERRCNDLRAKLEQAEARVAELLTVCQAVQRDLLLRAEPDWDGSGQQVVNLSAGFWEELNRVIGTYDDTACKSFDTMILRKQAEAVEEIVDADPDGRQEDGGALVAMDTIWDYAQRLRQQADEAEKAGGEK